MKKYNKSEIFKRAWELVKKAGMTISEGLKRAWKEAKNMSENIVEKFIGMGADRWTKYGKDRLYFNTREFLNNIGLCFEEYNSGNISNATLNGEKISNSKCRKLIGYFNNMWYNIIDGKLEYKKMYVSDEALDIIKSVIK